MKNLFKYIGLISLLLFSFYYTEKMSNVVINNNSLVIKINEESKNYNVFPVSAIIEDEYIIPGLNGYAVNVLKSYDNMRYLDSFNSYYLEYDIIKPSISLENNKDKIIKSGNKNKKSVSIIVDKNIDVLNYCISKKINIDKLIRINEFVENALYEQINYDIDNYKKLDNLMNKYNLNNNICYVNNMISLCKKYNKYLVLETYNLSNYNLKTIKDNIESGNIIFVNDNVSLSDFKLLLKQIYFKDLDVIYLSDLIKEDRS